MKEIPVAPIIMAFDVGHDLKAVAAEYVDKFNKHASFMIQKYSTREPSKAEIELFFEWALQNTATCEQVDGHWECVSEDKKVRKQVFVLVPDKVVKLPANVTRLRPGPVEKAD